MKIYCAITGGTYGTASGYRYWSFWKENEQGIDFALSPSVHNIKQATRLVHRYYPGAEVIFGGDFAGKTEEYCVWRESVWGKHYSE